MNTFRCVSLTLASTALVIAVTTSGSPPLSAQDQSGSRDQRRRARFSHDASVDSEVLAAARSSAPVEALAGFANRTNGFDPQGPPYDSLSEDTVVPLRSFNDNRFIFEEAETAEDGLGPTYNAQSCRECHQNIVTGGASQVTVLRAGHLRNGQFFESQGGSLIHSRATHPDASESLTPADPVRAFRISPTTLGDGYIEAIANDTLFAIRDAQPQDMRGLAVIVPVLEASGRARVGRFGWKAQHASLESFAADAYLNEMGITTPLLPDENTANGRDVTGYDAVPGVDDDGVDARAFANFMRATQAPPRGTITPAVAAGEQVFNRFGCATCHVSAIVTALPGTSINGGALTVSAALGNRVVHAYSDFLLHDVGTGDGIPIQPTAEYAATANRIRTAPLWGLRTRNRLMHDGTSLTLEEAILRHAGQAAGVTRNYRLASGADRGLLLQFLRSL